ncbi:hypothetical protein FHX82_000205 [Amycolatopsis bartoniae]|uniref:hypothetical protein n=1 Tax=Amycolatopsis bartoniae TaxID=941986 RepID=UPI0011932B70|nr:hypothetical protein [Amycolatopsis bartoniae]MBB2933185.1 hypothetical protein [Amycolatopsis bartoniae]TVT11824.1 hypothetical protein FNH07_00410 [Amycolatopsis bartoniae]
MAVPVGNVVAYVAVCAGPLVGFWLASKLPRLADALVDHYRSRRPVPEGPPIERIAADLRRVRLALERIPPRAPALRRRATEQAYDALLAQACRAVGEPQWLDTVPEGLEHEAERLRVEESLHRCGILR